METDTPPLPFTSLLPEVVATLPRYTADPVELDRRVLAGVAYLDREIPGWWRDDHEAAIDPDDLNMAWAAQCVLGQLGTDYDGMVRQLDLAGGDAVAYGFQAAGQGAACTTRDRFCACGEGEYTALTERWRAVILDRRGITL